jgi:hypothetical protein
MANEWVNLMTNGIISISPSSNYIPMYQCPIFTCICCLYLAGDSICKSLFDVRSVLIRGSLLTNKLMLQGFLLSRLQAAVRNFIVVTTTLFANPTFFLAKCCLVSDQSISRFWHTDLDYGLYYLPGLEIGLTASMTGRQGMPTPPRHMIPPLVYPEAHGCPTPFSELYFLLEFSRSMIVRYLCYNMVQTSHGGFLVEILIPPPVYPGDRVSPFTSLICISYLYFETVHSLVSWLTWLNSVSPCGESGHG